MLAHSSLVIVAHLDMSHLFLQHFLVESDLQHFLVESDLQHFLIESFLQHFLVESTATISSTSATFSVGEEHIAVPKETNSTNPKEYKGAKLLLLSFEKIINPVNIANDIIVIKIIILFLFYFDNKNNKNLQTIFI
jgi:hypothetical protein